MPEVLSVADLANELGCPRRIISDAFYRGIVPDDGTVIVAGRRLIPRGRVARIRRRLAESGKLEMADAV